MNDQNKIIDSILDNKDMKTAYRSRGELLELADADIKQLADALEQAQRDCNSNARLNKKHLDRIEKLESALRLIANTDCTEPGLMIELAEKALVIAGDSCQHPVHSNPGLAVPCPECGDDPLETVEDQGAPALPDWNDPRKDGF